MTLQWIGHDDGFMWAVGRKGRYEISEGYGEPRGMVQLVTRNHAGEFCGSAYLHSIEHAKTFAQEFDK